ncbi:transcription-repair coupling factor [Gammaproteobacteria bacterium]|nr:transcription-repair coupling factor [Gammaproteobacteria bacterium]
MKILSKGINLVSNLVGSSYLLEIDNLTKQYKYIVVLVHNNHQIDSLFDELDNIYSDRVLLKYPNYGIANYDSSPVDQDIIKNRLNCLKQIKESDACNTIIIGTYKSIFDKIPSIEDSSKSWSTVSKNSKYTEICDLLKKYQYKKVTKVEERGQYRISGSIIDYFSTLDNHPVRINFYGDEIETLKKFDVLTQLSNINIEFTTIGSSGLYYLNTKNIEKYKEYISNYFDDEYKDDLEYEAIVDDRSSINIQNLIPSFYNKTYSLLSLIRQDFVCFMENDIRNEHEEQLESLKNTYKQESINRYILKPEDLIISTDTLANIMASNYFYLPTNSITKSPSIKSSYSPLPSVSINYNYKNPFTNFENLYNESTYIYTLFIQRDDNFKTIKNYFESKNIQYEEVSDLNHKSNNIRIFRSDINQGFIDNSKKAVYISSNDLFGLIKARISKNKSIKTIIIDNLKDLKINELVVHQDHGIGKYKGLITMNIESKTTELIKIEYADNNNLYIPITSISLMQRYIGNSGLNTKLADLGTDRWSKIKQRAKKKIQDTAAELLLIQAKRELHKGYKYSFDTNNYQKFCKLFPYVETDDQLNCINEVIDDMCSTKAMDRVVCGDVGFGKTEVILRAAFIAAANKKQVVIIVPTTVLAKQHYQTFENRFSGYKYKINLMTRVLSTSEKNSSLENIKNGNAHIIIGTHALLNKSIKYNNLGLLIIDEEHKFGVKHKELIKGIKEDIDVLSLTATPIPRTLNSALSEIKDMSIINTPPVGRRDIETKIIEKSEELISQYIDREINRGGQVLFIHNNIDTMDEEINFIKKINDSYKIEKVHGRLKNKEIEMIMSNFINEKIDILVCTSIVESGLDMANVNTIIINNAQNFGLSQLHQIRGRVGRSNKQAYAGLILCNSKNITKDADLRIDAFIKTNSLAGGLDIAGHDLDIRGAGEILGEEQSGQILEIGYGMYTSMLSKAINQIKNKKNDDSKQHVEVDAYISTLIPQEYIEDIFLRLEFYSDISNVQNEYELNQIIVKLIDIYGPMPEYLENLIDLTRIRMAANIINAEKVKINRGSTVITLNKKSAVNQDNLITKYVNTGNIILLNEFTFKYKYSSEKHFLDICKEVINIFKSISI